MHTPTKHSRSLSHCRVRSARRLHGFIHSFQKRNDRPLLPRLLLADLHTATPPGVFLPLQAAPFLTAKRCTAGGANDFVMALSGGCYFAGGAMEMVPKLAVGDEQTRSKPLNFIPQRLRTSEVPCRCSSEVGVFAVILPDSSISPP